MFFSWLDWVHGLGEEDHRGQVPFSSHSIKGMYYQIIVVEMFALITWMRCSLSDFPTMDLLFFSSPLPYCVHGMCSILWRWQRMRWLDGITNSIDLSLSKTLGDAEGQGRLACCSPWWHRESDTTERLKNKYCVLWKEVTVSSPRLRTGKLSSTSERGQHRHPWWSWSTRGTWFKGHWWKNTRPFAKSTLKHIELTTRKSACPFKNVWLWVQCKDK